MTETTDQPQHDEQAAGETPVPDPAAPAPDPGIPGQQQEAAMTQAPEETDAAARSARIAELEDELHRLRAAAVANAKALLAVKGPHSEFTYAGVTVRTEPTPVPEGLIPAMMAAATDAGVTLTQEG